MINPNGFNGGDMKIMVDGQVVGTAQNISLKSVEEVGIGASPLVRSYGSISGTMELVGFPVKPRSKKKRAVQKWQKAVYAYRAKFWLDLKGIV
jgi:hypothetical protein